MYKIWNNEETNLLINNKNKDLNYLTELIPTKTKLQIKNKKRVLKISKEFSYNIEKLLENSLETFYWIGFILADGHISRNLEVSLSINDIEHLKKFSKYINKNIEIIEKIGGYTKLKTKSCRIVCYNKKILSKIALKFDISPQKTYNPPDISKYNFTDDQLLSLFIGFVDGDGSIINSKNKNSISIKVHGSWISVLEHFCNFLIKIFNYNIPKPLLNKEGYAVFRFSKGCLLADIKNFIIKNNLPVLERKWDKVNENFVKFSKAKRNKENIINFYKSGLSIKEISDKTLLCKEHVKRILKKENIF